jgi:hypothetical protein
MKKAVFFLIVIFALVSIQAIAQDTVTSTTEVFTKSKIFDFLKEVNPLNIALLAISIFAGGLWAMGRNKLKQISDLFEKAYEYTDDKRLSQEERADLMQRFLQIIGKSTAVNTDSKNKKK